MKRYLIVLTVIVAVSLIGLGIYNSHAQTKEVVEVVKDVGTAIAGSENSKLFHCRCKAGGCYGGNAFSFRPSCAKSDKTIICSDWIDNCVKK